MVHWSDSYGSCWIIAAMLIHFYTNGEKIANFFIRHSFDSNSGSKGQKLQVTEVYVLNMNKCFWFIEVNVWTQVNSLSVPVIIIKLSKPDIIERVCRYLDN